MQCAIQHSSLTRGDPHGSQSPNAVQRRNSVVSQPIASAAPGGPPGPVDGGGAGNSGRGDDSQGDGHQSSPKNSLLKGWEERIAADPQFTYKVFVEQVNGACCCPLIVLGNAATS